AEVVDTGVIEGRRPGDHPETGIATKLGVVVERLGLGAVVIDDYDFVVFVSGAQNGGKASLQRGTVVLIGDDDGDERAPHERVIDFVQTKSLGILHRTDLANPIQVFTEGLLRRIISVHLGFGGGGTGSFMHSPVIEDLAEVDDVTGGLGGAQNEIVV